MAAARRLVRPLMGLVLLGAIAWWLEPASILGEVQRLSPGWALLALALTLPPLLLSAWRWRLTARLLGLSLSFRRALREYYLALFINQVVPGGVVGDAARAWRHSRDSGRRGGAWRAVIIERASGQLAMALLTLAVLAASPLWHDLLGRAAGKVSASGWLPGAAIALALPVAIGVWLARRPPAPLVGLGGDLRRSLLAASVWPKQLAGSLLVVASYALVFVCAARAIGVGLPVATLLALVPPVLLAMLIPLSFAGWGVREGAAALVWGLAGLPPAQGVAVAMAYGALVLLASLPGGLVLLRRRTGAAHAPEGSGVDGPGGEGAEGEGSEGEGSESKGSEGGGIENEIKKGVIAAGEGPRRGAACLIEGGDGRHGETRPPGADQQRRHQQVQPLQHARFEKARHRDAAALDQHPLEAPGGQGVEHRRGREAAFGQRQRQTRHVAPRGACRAGTLAVQVQGRRVGIGQQPTGRRDPAAGVEDHPYRMGAGDVAHREQRVVLAGGAGADHHGIHQGAKPVQMHQALRPVDVVGVAALGGDASVQALTELGHGEPAGAGGQRGQAVKQIPRLGCNGAYRLPAGRRERQARYRGDAVGRMGCVEKGLPGLFEKERRVGGAHGASVRDVDSHHAWIRHATQSIRTRPGESDASG